MEGLFNHPAVQSALVPLVVALMTFFIGHKIKPELSGLAGLLAFLATVYLVKGMSLSPLTSTNKIIVVAIISTILGLVLDLLSEKLAKHKKYTDLLLALLAVTAIMWVIWPVVTRESTANPWLISVGLSLYVAWIVTSIGIYPQKKEQISAVILALGIGTGIVSIIGATSLYGQLAIPFAAAAGGWMLLYIFKLVNGRALTSFYFTASLVCSILGAAATVYADLPWLTLVIFAFIPVVIFIPIKQASARFTQLAIATFAAMIPVIIAIWYTAQQSADSGYYG